METRTCEARDEEHTLPSVEALMAGTLALLTGYAQSAPDCTHRPLMARKLVSNLFFLSEHPQLSPAMRSTLANLRTRWQLDIEQASTTQPGALWHPAAASVQ